MLTHDPDITRLMARLEKRGLAQRKRSRIDRRVITSRISSAGLDLLQKLDQPILDSQQRLLGGLGAERVQGLIDLLQNVRDRSI